MSATVDLLDEQPASTPEIITALVARGISVTPLVLHAGVSSTEAGESEDSLEVAYNGDALTIGFNAAYLVEFLKASGTAEVRLELKDPQSAGQLRPAEGDDYKYRYIVMPMRI